MSGQPLPPVLGQDMRQVRRELAGADDQRVLQVLRFVESLADPTQAAGLLAPLRDRLRVLRPSRQLRFARVLFSPLDPVIVDPGDWRPGEPTLPRTVIMPITDLIRSALPAHTAHAETVIKTDASYEDRILAAGRAIWSEAGKTLHDAAPPADWGTTAIPAALFRDLARGCATVLRTAWPLYILTDPLVPMSDLTHALTTMLHAAEADGAVAWGMLLTVMMQAFPQSEAPWKAAAGKRVNAAMRQAADMALDAAWDWVEKFVADPGMGEPAEVAAALRRQIGLLQELQRDPAHRRRAASLQTALRNASVARFEAGIENLLLAPMRKLTEAAARQKGTMQELEADARALRHLDGEARRLGTGAPFDAALNQAAGVISSQTVVPVMDRARLMEILVGGQAALRLLSAQMQRLMPA